MARGDKSKYTSKQTRQEEHIEEGYKKRGVSAKEAKRRAWATENAISGGGRTKGGSGRGKKASSKPTKKGGKKGGRASASRSAAARSRSAKKGAATRKRNKSHGRKKSSR